MSFIANTENVFVPAGRLYARKLTETRPADFGLTRTFEFDPDVEEVELRNNNNGVDSVFTTRLKQIGGTVNIELDLMTARNLAFWAYGEAAFVTQDAETGLTITATNILPGQITKLNGMNITNLSLTDGSEPLVSGVDYAFDASAGLIRWLTEQSSVTGTYNRPELTASDKKSIIKLMTKAAGVEVVLTCYGTSDTGQRVLLEDMRVRLRPGGPMGFINQDDDFGGIALEGTLVFNDLSPDAPYGRITFL